MTAKTIDVQNETYEKLYILNQLATDIGDIEGIKLCKKSLSMLLQGEKLAPPQTRKHVIHARAELVATAYEKAELVDKFYSDGQLVLCFRKDGEIFEKYYPSDSRVYKKNKMYEKAEHFKNVVLPNRTRSILGLN